MARVDMEDEGLRRFLQAAANHRLLTGPQELALARRRDRGGPAGEAARHELVVCNLRLVLSIARYYRNRGLPFADVVQEGILGLDRASRKFDPARGFRFSTYATLWIRQAIRRGLSGSGATIRLPSQVAEHRAKGRARLREDADADLRELAKELEIPYAELQRAMEAAEVVTSLDREVSVEGDFTHTLLDTLPDMLTPTPGEEIPEVYADLHHALLDLPAIQREVIELRFGFGGGVPLNLAEVAERLGRSTTTVQTAQREGLRALREQLLD